jgi:hypothetical protein
MTSGDVTTRKKVLEDRCMHLTSAKIMSHEFGKLLCCFQSRDRFIMHAIEIPSCAVIFVPSFLKICTSVQTVLRFASEI